jgi:ABC-type branched-subunit amino acid transport system substrate-binding protein
MAPVAQAKSTVVVPPRAQQAPQPSRAAPVMAVPGGGEVKVALLLPLSGSSSALGQSMLDAANLAVFDLADKSFDLLPEDTGDTPEGAKKAAEQAVAAGAKLIVGPLFASSTAAVKPVAFAAGVNVVSFTTDSAQAGGNVFIMGFLPSTQISRVAGYALAHGVSRIAALVPDTAYGSAAVAALQASGAPIAGIAQLHGGSAEIAPALQSVMTAGPADALFIPEGGDRLREIARTARASGMDAAHVRLLGTGLWDDPTLGQEPALLGGWYAGTAPAARADFERKFDATYHYKPQRLATLAYDATALAVVVGRQATPGQNPYTAAALAKPTGFIGTDGIFRFDDNGEIERGLAVLQVGIDGPVVIDPAPRAFGAPAPRTGM